MCLYINGLFFKQYCFMLKTLFRIEIISIFVSLKK